MTDPVHATLWLIVAAVLVLCLGGTLIAAGLWRRPDPQRGELPRRGIGEAIAADTSDSTHLRRAGVRTLTVRRLTRQSFPHPRALLESPNARPLLWAALSNSDTRR